MTLEALGRRISTLHRLRRTLLTAVVAVLAFTASGCQTTGGTSGTAGLSRPQDPYCESQYQALKEYDDVFQRALAAGAISAVAAGLITGDWRVALISGVVGALVTNYGLSLERKQAAERESIYVGDVNGENQVIDSATGAFNALTRCRFAAADRVRADWKAGRISKAQAGQQMSSLSELYQWDVRLARKMQVRINQRGEEFAEASSLVGGPGNTETRALPPAPATTTAAAAADSGQVRETHTWSNVRAGPGTSHAKVATLEPGKQVALLGPAEGAASWSRIRLDDGREGFIANSLLVRPGEKPRSKPQRAAPPADTTTVAGVTQSNQVKRQAFANTIDEADSTAQVAFELDEDEQLGLRLPPETRAHS